MLSGVKHLRHQDLRRTMRRNMQKLWVTYKYKVSNSPMKSMSTNYTTIFFDYEGKWAVSTESSNSRKGVEHVISVLKSYGIPATFNIVGNLIFEEADIINRISEDGHEIACHTVAHTLVHTYSPKAVEEEILKFRAMMKGVTPKIVGFRAPQDEWNRNTLSGLLNAGVTWNAQVDPAPHPYVILSKDHMRLWRMPVTIDDWAMEGFGLSPAEMYNIWLKANNEAQTQHRFFSIGFHPWILGRDTNRLVAFSRFVEYLSSKGETKIATFAEIADLCETNI